MSKLNSKQLLYPLSGSFTGSLLGSASYASASSTSTTSSYVKLIQGSNVNIIYTSNGIIISSAGTGSGQNAAGSTGQIQYNTGNGVFGGVDTLTYDGTTLRATGSFSGSLRGTATTASYITGSTFTGTNPALSSSYALTASYALNAGGGTGVGFPFSGSAVITGSLLVSGSGISITGSLNVTNGITGSVFGYVANSQTSSLVSTSSFNNFTSSVVTTSSFNSLTSSIVFTSSFNSFTSSVVTTSSFNNFTSSVVTTSSFNNLTSSLVTTSSFNNWTGSNLSQFAGTASYVTGSIFSSTNPVLSSSYALTASYALNAGGGTGVGFPFSGSAVITGSLLVSGSGIAITGSLNVSSSIKAYNINVGTPSSNQWGQNLNGSYFNVFNSNTDTSEILRFVAGLLSASAPAPSPNTITLGPTLTATAQNTTVGAVTLGSVPNSSTNATINYLISKGFATPGQPLFYNVVGPIYTNFAYGYKYTNTVAGSTQVSSSNTPTLFGLGPIQNATTPYDFYVKGDFNFSYSNNSNKTQTANSSSTTVLSHNQFSTNANGLTIGKIPTSNPSVIPSAYQDGTFVSAFSPSIFSGSEGYGAATGSGYYDISASIQVASGSSAYSTPVTDYKRIFWAPIANINAGINYNSNYIPAYFTVSALTAVSRSLSGAPYLVQSTYSLSSSANNLFNPMYAAIVDLMNTSISTTDPNAYFEQYSNITGNKTLSTLNGTINNNYVVYDSTGNIVRSVGSIPYETDIVKIDALISFNPSTTGITLDGSTNVQYSVTSKRRDNQPIIRSNTLKIHEPGTFNQPIDSGSLKVYGRAQNDFGDATATYEPFQGENYRIILDDSILSFNGSAWNTNFYLYNLGPKELQVFPGKLVKPGGYYGYWITDTNPGSDYKYYVRKFSTNGTTKNSMTLNCGRVLDNWRSPSNQGVSALIFFKSGNNTIYGQAKFFDPTELTSAGISTLDPLVDGQNPFSSKISLNGNNGSGAGLSGTTYTVPLRNSDGMILNSTYGDIYILIRYYGDSTPISSITVAFS